MFTFDFDPCRFFPPFFKLSINTQHPVHLQSFLSVNWLKGRLKSSPIMRSAE